MGRTACYILYFAAFLGGLIVPKAEAQTFWKPSEVGVPFPSEHYSTQEYGMEPQNWAITQDHRGMIYVANTGGILEFDGTRWRTIPPTASAAPDAPAPASPDAPSASPDAAASSDSSRTGPVVRSLVTAPDGRVYVGADGDIGVLRPDSAGVLAYASLAHLVPASMRPFENVWTVAVAGDDVFFQTREHLFRLRGDSLSTWTSEGGFHTAFAVHDRIFVRDIKKGLMELSGDRLQVVPAGETFEETSIYLMEPYPDGRILIGTARDGLYLYDGADLERLPTEADAFLERHRLYQGTLLQDRFYALATLGGGVVVIDASGRVVQKLSPSLQLPDGVVNYVYPGREGELWMAFNNSGVMRSDVLSPRSTFDESMGLKGTIRDIDRYGGRLYVATGMGLYVLQRAPRESASDVSPRFARFEKVPDVPIAFDLQSSRYGLLMATQGGVYRLSGDRLVRLTSNSAFDLSASAERDDRVFVATRDGISILESIREDNPSLRALKGVTVKAASVKAMPDGSLWMSMSRGRVLRLRYPQGLDAPPVVQEYTTRDGLADAYHTVTTIDGQIVILSRRTVFRVEPVADTDRVRFVPDPSLMPDGDAPLEVLQQIASGELWALRGDRVFTAPSAEPGRVDWTSVDPLHFPKTGVSAVRVEDDGIVWLSDANRLIRYDPGAYRPRNAPFAAYVRQVTAITDGHVVFGGTREASPGGRRTPATVPFTHNDLSIDVSAPFYNVTSPNQYQARLEGSHEAWTEWRTNPNFVYTNLRERTYRFHVRARNERGVVSEPAPFVFRVEPPWYRTLWAYALYGGCFVLLGFGLRRYYLVMEENERQRKRTQHLEREKLANERLQRANRRLRQANELKENFLASTSHELRTPLTNILGFSDVVRSETPPAVHGFVDVIESNGRRLLRTLNALLDLASLRAGEMRPTIGRVDVVETVHEIACEYQTDADRKGIDFEVHAPQDRPIHALLDARYLEQILRNLFDNAIKFTDDGAVQVDVQASSDTVVVRVIDTGIGIDQSFMPDLFRDFKQESQGLARTYEGSGLGLAITARLVELMSGAITVKSEKGEGSTFTVRFPRQQTASRAVRNGRVEQKQ